jgi:hypothetical protein
VLPKEALVGVGVAPVEVVEGLLVVVVEAEALASAKE